MAKCCACGYVCRDENCDRNRLTHAERELVAAVLRFPEVVYFSSAMGGVSVTMPPEFVAVIAAKRKVEKERAPKKPEPRWTAVHYELTAKLVDGLTGIECVIVGAADGEYAKLRADWMAAHLNKADAK